MFVFLVCDFGFFSICGLFVAYAIWLFKHKGPANRGPANLFGIDCGQRKGEGKTQLKIEKKQLRGVKDQNCSGDQV